MPEYSLDPSFAKTMDMNDPLKGFRDRFEIPEGVYFAGNSLGPLPKALPDAMMEQLNGWGRLGVEGHWTQPCDWLPIHETVNRQLATIVGAKPSEVVAMGTLTANLHHLMTSFYSPDAKRFKILFESNAFPSDRYAIASHIDARIRQVEKFVGKGKAGFTVEDAMLEIQPRPGEITLRDDDIVKTIENQGTSIALIMLGGNNFYTGQVFDMAHIAKAGHEKGCTVGFDLAHSVGNVKLDLHSWGVDFACWCPYKYLNSGPGGIGGIFVHEKHHKNPDLPRHEGWWSNKPSTRFEMRHDVDPFETAERWQVSNPPVFSLIPVRVSLDMFMEAGPERLREKSWKLTGYLEFLLDSLETDAFKIITPRDPERRGAQISIAMKENGRRTFDAMEKARAICDWRNPDCIRISPAPLFNSFEDVYICVQILARELGLELGQSHGIKQSAQRKAAP